MRTKELLIIAVVHAGSFVVAAAVIRLLHVGDPGLALVMGAVGGSNAAAMQYHRRMPERAPFAVKASAGAVLAVMAVLMGLASQLLLKWMTYPDVVIPISFVGSFVFPFVLFGTLRRAYAGRRS